MNSAPLTGPLDAATFRNIAKAASPSVVNIRTRVEAEGPGHVGLLRRGRPVRPLLRQPPQGRGNPQPREQVVEAAGTGFVISKDGYILTNNHVVEGATEIFVAFGENDADVEEYKAKLVGRDQLTDSALIQLEEKPTHAAGRGEVRRLEPDADRATG